MKFTKHIFATKILGLLVLGLWVSTNAQAQEVQAPSGTYVNDPGHTSLLWKINHLGLSNYTARVNDPEITLKFNAEDVEKSSVMAMIDPLNVDTGFSGGKDFNKEIATEAAILNAGKFPLIEFKSTKITKTGDTTARIEGDLTLLGVTQPVSLDATYMGSLASHPFVKVPAIGFHAVGSFDRTQWGLTFLSGTGLGDRIEIEIQTEFLKKP